MTVVALPDSRLQVFARQVRDGRSLREWLAGRWAVLFSHPVDFTQEGLEMDRWIDVLSRSFHDCGVAAVALARAGSKPVPSWLGHLAALDGESVAALEFEAVRDTPAARPADALRAHIGHMSHIAHGEPRFAMIIDSTLHCRRTLSYRLPAELPSPLDLIGWAVSLRKRDRAEESPPQTQDTAALIRAAWARNARCAVAQSGRS